MGRKASVLLVLMINLWYCNAQELSVSKPVLDTLGAKLVIKYDILNGKPGEKYKVSLEVVDAQGRIINSQSAFGDIGTNVEAGLGKQIIWDYRSDYVKEEVRIVIRISIERIPAGSFSGTDNTVSAEPGMGSLLLQSLAVPGLGLSKIYDGKPYWLIGVGGYGMIAGSLILHSSSKSNYDSFLNSGDPVAEEEYYDKYKSQKTASTVLAAGAAALWVTDLAIVYLIYSKRSNTPSGSKDKILSIIPEYNAEYHTTIIKLRYRF